MTQQELIVPLNEREKSDLAKLENRIEKSVASVAKDLKEIRDRKLYRDYGSWEQYVEERWDKTRQWAHYEVTWYEVQEKLKAVNPGLQISKKDSRELAPLHEDVDGMVRAIVLAENKARQQGTQRSSPLIKEAVEEITGKQASKGRKQKKLEKVKKELTQLETELAAEDPLPALLSPQAADQEEQQQEEQQQGEQTPEQSVMSTALTFIEAKLTEQQLAITVEQTVKLLESLGIELTSIKVK